jgi:sulfate permease, SulP family
VVLPQAIAFSTTLAGLLPYFGIYAAIFNPARVFHGGPNSTLSAVMGVMLLPIAPQFGQSYMGYALNLVLMAGLLQLLFVLIRPLAKLLDLMSEALINGMIGGIGVFLIFKSIVAFGGLPINTQVEWPLLIAWQSLLSVLEVGNLYAIQVGMVALSTIMIVHSVRKFRNLAILLGILVGTVYAQYLGFIVGPENTLLEQTADLSEIGRVLPSLPLFNQAALPDMIAIIPGAITLAMLGLIQTVAAVRRMNQKTG